MSAPLRKMGSQFRRLDTKFLSARNFSSKEVPEAPVRITPLAWICEKLTVVAMGGTVGLGIALFCQKQIHGRVVHILGFPVGRDF